MAKDTDFNIVIGAEADESSADKAVNKISKRIEKVAKGGRIEVPIDITIPIDKNKDKLTKAQQAVATKISKMTAKGFSASGKDIDALTSKFNEFTKVFDQAGKGRQNKVFKEIRKQVEDLQKAYNANRPAKVTSTNKRSSNKQKFSQEAINAALNKSYEDYKWRTGQKRRLAGVKQAGPKGFKRNFGFDSGVATKDTVQASDFSPYRSNWARQMKVSELASIKWMQDSLKIYKNNELANKISGKMTLTDSDVASEKAQIASNQLAKILGGLEHNRIDASIEKFNQYLDGILKFNKDSGKNDWNGIFLALNKTFNRYASKGAIGATDGNKRGEYEGHMNAMHALAGMMKRFKDVLQQDALVKIGEKQLKWSAEEARQLKELAKIDPRAAEKYIDSILYNKKSTSKTSSKSSVAENSMLQKELNDLSKEQKSQNSAITKQTQLDTIEHSAERVADETLFNVEKTDAEDGFNSEQKSNTLIEEVKDIKKDIEEGLKTDTEEIPILSEYTLEEAKPSEKGNNDKNNPLGFSSSTALSLYRSFKDGIWKIAGVVDKTAEILDGKKVMKLPTQDQYDKAYHKAAESEVEYQRDLIEKGQHPSQQRSNMVQLSQDVSKALTDSKIWGALKKAFGIPDKSRNADAILAMNQADVEKIQADIVTEYGLPKSNDPTATGGKAQSRYMKFLYGRKQTGEDPFKDLTLSEGLNFDLNKITEATRSLIDKNMFSMQTGGFLKNIIGPMTLYAGQPSLEKSRAQIEGANSIMAEIRDVILEKIQAIQIDETALRGLESSGKAFFNKDGTLDYGRSSEEAKKLFPDLEQQKESLNGIVAEVRRIDELVKSTGGDVTKVLQQLGFAFPELRKCNKMISNLNAGLDKNGKALKFQTRTAEILNYSFQLMGRHIGQMIKRWILMLNPISLIKRAFQDFASYDVKWQRTMNVIKYNFRRIIRPAMEWIAQQIVNIIGLVNALIKGIGKAFGKDWDLFDKEAADAEKMREELEAAANVTAGFDELHDIGGDSSNPAMDFLSEDSDIYTPQWEGLYEIFERIGESIGNFGKTIKETIDGIKKLTEGWDFWDWLAIAGVALLGFLALKAIIGWFTKGKNPLQSVADGFKSLEKAIGWALIIAALALFVKELTNFFQVTKDIETSKMWEIFGVLAACIGLVAVVALALVGLGKLFKIDWLAEIGVASMIAAFALLVLALTEFIKVVKDLDATQIDKIFEVLGGAIVILVAAIGALLVILAALIATGVGALAILALAAILAAVALVIAALALLISAINELVTTIAEHSDEIIKLMAVAGAILINIIRTIGETIQGIITTVGNAISQIIETITTGIQNTITTIGDTIVTIIQGIADAIMTVLQPIMDFIDKIIDKIIDLAKTIAHEIGDTIRKIIETVGDIILGIIHEIMNAIPNLLDSILRFCREIGPAIETSVDAIMRSVTKLINFMISGIEYMINTLVIGSINKMTSGIPFIGDSMQMKHVTIERFVPKYKNGTNYVPNDGLAYLHQGEAVVPKKYNQPYNQGLSNEERAYMQQMMATMKSLDGTMKQGISVNGQFVQRGSDLVATVNRTNSQTGADVLSNVSYAR